MTPHIVVGHNNAKMGFIDFHQSQKEFTPTQKTGENTLLLPQIVRKFLEVDTISTASSHQIY